MQTGKAAPATPRPELFKTPPTALQAGLALDDWASDEATVNDETLDVPLPKFAASEEHKACKANFEAPPTKEARELLAVVLQG
eukprot:11259109-Alexandrium_andersonii.AAC.1